MMVGLSVLFQLRVFSPLLVDRGEVPKNVRGIRYLERGRGNVVLMDPLHARRAEQSYKVTRGGIF